MQRKALQILLSSAFRGVPALRRIPSYSRFHTRSLLFSSEQVPKHIARSSVETVTDFSDHPADEFGTLAKEDMNEVLDQMPEEKEDKVQFDMIDEKGKKRRRKVRYYHDLIIKLLKEKKVADAIDVLETRMLKQDRVKPDFYIYNLLINGCARVGYTQKAFKLYNQMKRRDIKITHSTYTGLFNACANSPFPEDALIKTNNLRRQLIEKGIELNIINYNTLLKAYARLNDIKSAFYVADEMMNKNYSLTASSFNMLMSACISDKEAGFRHILLIWHKMRVKKVPLNVYTYNLLLKCVRTCGIGDQKEAMETIKLITDPAFYETKKKIAPKQSTPEEKSATDTVAEAGASSSNSIDGLTIEAHESADENEQVRVTSETLQEGADENEIVISEQPDSDQLLDGTSVFELVENRPNLLGSRPHLGTIVALKDIKTPSDRFLLLGGFKAFVNQMDEDDVLPNLKLFTQILDIIPSTLVAEETLLNYMEKFDIDLDIDFCNMLIKKRAYRMDYENGRNVLDIILRSYLNPDIVTFGVLALCCQNKNEALMLLKDMSNYGYRPNAEILGAMLKGACVKMNYDYVVFVMRLTAKKTIEPNLEFIGHLKALLKRSQEMFGKKFDKRTRKWNREVNDPEWYEQFTMFKDYYSKWRKEVTVFVPPHPYKQFRTLHNDPNQRQDEEEDDEDGQEADKRVKFTTGKSRYRSRQDVKERDNFRQDFRPNKYNKLRSRSKEDALRAQEFRKPEFRSDQDEYGDRTGASRTKEFKKIGFRRKESVKQNQYEVEEGARSKEFGKLHFRSKQGAEEAENVQQETDDFRGEAGGSERKGRGRRRRNTLNANKATEDSNWAERTSHESEKPDV